MTALILFIFLSPVVVLLTHISQIANPLGPELYRVLTYSSLQAGLTAVASLGLGLLGGFGLLSIKDEKWRRPAELFLLLPNLLPSLFIVVAILNGITFFTTFPFGVGGVVLVFTAMNVGVVAVATARLLEAQVGGMAELALVEGAGRGQFLWAIRQSLNRNLWHLFFFLFAMCFTSYAIPLIVGGESGVTLEVLIYRAALGQGRPAYALGLALIQIGFLAVISLSLQSSVSLQRQKFRRLKLLESKISLVALGLLTALILLSSLRGLGQGVAEIIHTPGLSSKILWTGFGSFFESLSVGLITFSFFILMSFRFHSKFLRKFLLAYATPSVVLTGLGIYLIYDAQVSPLLLTRLVIAVGFSLLVFPTLYRYRGEQMLEELKFQVDSARILGASGMQIAGDILIPQMWRDIAFLAGVAALWASGDFAFASLVAGRELTLAISAENLVGGYHLEVATAVTWCALLIGIMVYFFLQVVGRVGHSKSLS